jgi:hypothetical protein
VPAEDGAFDPESPDFEPESPDLGALPESEVPDSLGFAPLPL